MDGVPSDRDRGLSQPARRPGTPYVGRASVGRYHGIARSSPVARGRARVSDPGLVLPAPPGPVPTGRPGTVYPGGRYPPNGVAASGGGSVSSPPASTRSHPVPGESGPGEPAAQPVGGAPRPGRSRHRSSRRRRQLPLWQEVPLLLLAAFLIAVVIRTFLLQAFYIPSGSMEHTLDVGDKVLVNKVVYDVREPVRGEIVVFRGTARWAPEHQQPPTSLAGQIGRNLGNLVGFGQPGEKDFIKRVIGVPGDSVACCDANGRVTVNGHPLRESYIFEDALDNVPPSPTECRSRKFKPVTVPQGHIFVMGDHRIVSQDSRCQGPVPIENVIGRAFLVVWPAGRWDVLEVPDMFGEVPKPYAAGGTTGRYPTDLPGTVGLTSLCMVPVIKAGRGGACCRSSRVGPRRRLAG